MRYGVNIMLSKIYIDDLKDKNIEDVQYHYYIEITNQSDNNGNGWKNFKIYKGKWGNLEELKNEEWTISPIVKVGYGWGGYDVIELALEKDGENFEIELSAKRLGKFNWIGREPSLIIEYIFSVILKISNYSSVDAYYSHLEFISKMESAQYYIKEIESIYDLKLLYEYLLEISELKEQLKNTNSLEESVMKSIEDETNNLILKLQTISFSENIKI